MLSPRSLGLLLSIGLSLVSQKPVLPSDLVQAEPTATLTAKADVAETVVPAYGQAPAQDVAKFYDTDEKLWKRWSAAESGSLSMETSSDDVHWSAAGISLELVGSQQRPEAMLTQLKRLAAAYASGPAL